MPKSDETKQSIIDSIKNRFKSKKKKKKKKTKAKKVKKAKETIIEPSNETMAESTKETKKDNEVNKGSFNAKEDVRTQIWDYLNIK